MSRYVVVEAEVSLVAEEQDGGRREALGHGRDAEDRIGPLAACPVPPPWSRCRACARARRRRSRRRQRPAPARARRIRRRSGRPRRARPRSSRAGRSLSGATHSPVDRNGRDHAWLERHSSAPLGRQQRLGLQIANPEEDQLAAVQAIKAHSSTPRCSVTSARARSNGRGGQVTRLAPGQSRRARRATGPSPRAGPRRTPRGRRSGSAARRRRGRPGARRRAQRVDRGVVQRPQGVRRHTGRRKELVPVCAIRRCPTGKGLGASAMVGTSGQRSSRSRPVTARGRMVPASIPSAGRPHVEEEQVDLAATRASSRPIAPPSRARLRTTSMARGPTQARGVDVRIAADPVGAVADPPPLPPRVRDERRQRSGADPAARDRDAWEIRTSRATGRTAA